jgi:DNA-binding NarL/FixJ family response regulator
VALAQGRLDDAAAFAEEALAIWHEEGDAWGTARVLIASGRIAHARGDAVHALSRLCEALTACVKLGDKEIAARGIAALATIAAERGQFQLAAQFCGSVAALRDAIGAPIALAERARHEALVEGIRVHLPSSAFSVAWDAGCTLTLDEVIANAATLAETSGHSGKDQNSARTILTPREREVLEHLARGCTDKEIAAELFIGQRTVSTHVAAILAKLGVSSRGAAAVIALRDNPA